MSDVDISVGSETSGLQTGLADLRNYGEKVRGELSSVFAQSIAVGGIIAAFGAVIEKAHEIHHEAERFGVDAQALQLIANAAKADGVSIEGVARALNRLGIIGETTPEKLRALNISMEKWLALDPAGRFLLLADALQTTGLNSDSFNATVGLLGQRFGSQLIPTLLKGSDAIKEVGTSMGVMSDQAVESLERIHSNWAVLSNRIIVVGAPLVEFLSKVGLSAINGFGLAWHQMTLLITEDSKAINLAIHGNFAKAVKTIKNMFSTAVDNYKKARAEMAGIIAGPAEKKRAPFGVTPDIENDLAGIGRTSGTASGGSAGSSSAKGAEASLDRLAAKQRQFDLDQLDNANKLKYLALERKEIEDNLANGIRYQSLSEGQQAELEIKLLDNAEQRNRILQEMRKAQQQISEAREREAEAAEKELTSEERRNRYQMLINQFGEEQAAIMERQLEIEDKIAIVVDRIKFAYADGDKALASTLEKLKAQLELQKKINETQHQGEIDLKRFREQVDNFNKAQASGIRGLGVGGIGTGGATLADVAGIQQPGNARALGIAEIQDKLGLLSGKNPGFWEQLRRDQIVRAYAADQSRMALAFRQQTSQQETGDLQKLLYFLTSGQAGSLVEAVTLLRQLVANTTVLPGSH